MRGSLEQMMAQAKTSGRKEFPLVVKADVQGSLEAIIGALDKLGTEEVAARVLHAGVGGISESDVTLAEASGVPIIAFNVRANKEAREAAERAGIEIRYYNIIYDLVDDVKKAMSGLLPPTLRETMLGNAQILEIFNVSKIGKIAGCKVTDGTVERGANVRLIRDNVVIHEGKLSQLKRFKDDVREVGAGMVRRCSLAAKLKRWWWQHLAPQRTSSSSTPCRERTKRPSCCTTTSRPSPSAKPAVSVRPVAAKSVTASSLGVQSIRCCPRRANSPTRSASSPRSRSRTARRRWPPSAAHRWH